MFDFPKIDNKINIISNNNIKSESFSKNSNIDLDDLLFDLSNNIKSTEEKPVISTVNTVST